MPRRIRLWLACLVCAALAPAAARAHSLTITQVLASFEQPGVVDVKIDYDLSPLLPSPEAYYRLTRAAPADQRKAIDGLLPDIEAGLQLRAGNATLPLIFQGFSLPALSQANFDDPGVDKFTTFHFLAMLPASGDPISLLVPYGAKVEYPVAFIVQIPSAHISATSWIEEGSNESDPFDWKGAAPEAGAAAAAPAAPAKGRQALADMVDTMPWPKQLVMYLRLGFHHIVPEGTDHILFVLGLFFLGITWRKLISQTSVFTIAHATTLFLSTYGIFSLPSKYVEPAIALSIAFIALENVFAPRLGPGRLAVVFGFGLIHGLGFASSLSEVPFPKHRFIVALLGFNFGVDFGQLFIIGIAFLLVGWFRHRPWFRKRIAIPCSLAIAAIGIFWAIQRIVFYYGGHHGT
ncbi:MAG TPA: HupE/UreJ family protein [Opitutaceae bacterium]|nr:HupE/UreJ family protein [Opitutaceae bacterium]